MPMFKPNPAYHVGHLIDRTEGGRPIRDRQTGVVAGDKSSSNDENKSSAGGKNSEAVMRPIVWCGEKLQMKAP